MLSRRHPPKGAPPKRVTPAPPLPYPSPWAGELVVRVAPPAAQQEPAAIRHRSAVVLVIAVGAVALSAAAGLAAWIFGA